jgi:hypothetical protein
LSCVDVITACAGGPQCNLHCAHRLHYMVTPSALSHRRLQHFTKLAHTLLSTHTCTNAGPTWPGSIRLETPDPLVKAAAATFPLAVDPVTLPGIYHLGYHSEDSFGAAAWLIAPASAAATADSASASASSDSALAGASSGPGASNGFNLGGSSRGGGGNGHSSSGHTGGGGGGGFGVMVDSPRYCHALADGVRAALGGAEPRYMVLSHEVSGRVSHAVLSVTPSTHPEGAAMRRGASSAPRLAAVLVVAQQQSLPLAAAPTTRCIAAASRSPQLSAAAP